MTSRYVHVFRVFDLEDVIGDLELTASFIHACGNRCIGVPVLEDLLPAYGVMLVRASCKFVGQAGVFLDAQIWIWLKVLVNILNCLLTFLVRHSGQSIV